MYALISNRYSNKHILICLGLMICEYVYAEAEHICVYIEHIYVYFQHIYVYIKHIYVYIQHIYVYIHAKRVFKQTYTCMFGLDGM